MRVQLLGNLNSRRGVQSHPIIPATRPGSNNHTKPIPLQIDQTPAAPTQNHPPLGKNMEGGHTSEPETTAP